MADEAVIRIILQDGIAGPSAQAGSTPPRPQSPVSPPPPRQQPQVTPAGQSTTTPGSDANAKRELAEAIQEVGEVFRKTLTPVIDVLAGHRSPTGGTGQVGRVPATVAGVGDTQGPVTGDRFGVLDQVGRTIADATKATTAAVEQLTKQIAADSAERRKSAAKEEAAVAAHKRKVESRNELHRAIPLEFSKPTDLAKDLPLNYDPEQAAKDADRLNAEERRVYRRIDREKGRDKGRPTRGWVPPAIPKEYEKLPIELRPEIPPSEMMGVPTYDHRETEPPAVLPPSQKEIAKQDAVLDKEIEELVDLAFKHPAGPKRDIFLKEAERKKKKKSFEVEKEKKKRELEKEIAADIAARGTPSPFQPTEPLTPHTGPRSSDFEPDDEPPDTDFGPTGPTSDDTPPSTPPAGGAGAAVDLDAEPEKQRKKQHHQDDVVTPSDIGPTVSHPGIPDEGLTGTSAIADDVIKGHVYRGRGSSDESIPTPLVPPGLGYTPAPDDLEAIQREKDKILGRLKWEAPPAGPPPKLSASEAAAQGLKEDGDLSSELYDELDKLAVEWQHKAPARGENDPASILRPMPMPKTEEERQKLLHREKFGPPEPKPPPTPTPDIANRAIEEMTGAGYRFPQVTPAQPPLALPAPSQLPEAPPPLPEAPPPLPEAPPPLPEEPPPLPTEPPPLPPYHPDWDEWVPKPVGGKGQRNLGRRQYQEIIEDIGASWVKGEADFDKRKNRSGQTPLKRDEINAIVEILKQSGRSPKDVPWFRFAHGGSVPNHPGQPQGTDTIPAWLSPGEYVVNSDAAAKHHEELEQINKGVKHLADGGEAKKDPDKKEPARPYTWTGLSGTGEATRTLARDDPGESLARLGDITQKVAGQIPGLGTAANFAGESLKGLSLVVSTLNQAAERYGQYSPEIAQAQATAEVMQVMGDLRRARELGPSMASFLIDQAERQQRFEDIKVKLLMQIAPAVTKLFELFATVTGPSIEALSAAVSGLVDMVKSIGVDLGSIAKDKEENKLAIDPTEQLKNKLFKEAGEANDNNPGWVPWR